MRRRSQGCVEQLIQCPDVGEFDGLRGVGQRVEDVRIGLAWSPPDRASAMLSAEECRSKCGDLALAAAMLQAALTITAVWLA